MAQAPEKPALKVLLCSPRGFCAGVVRAIESVERALEIYGAPVYVRHEIVHNRYVVDSLRAKGAIFVEELDEIPDDQRAGGVLRPRRAETRCRPRREQRKMFSLDATCPLVTKVHREAELHSTPRPRNRPDRPCRPPRGGRHHGPAARRRGDADRDRRRRGRLSRRATRHKLAFVTQTTLSVDDTAEIVDAPARALSRDRRAAQGRHLLRHHQPPGSGQDVSRPLSTR